jgi:hypothetical protein
MIRLTLRRVIILWLIFLIIAYLYLNSNKILIEDDEEWYKHPEVYLDTIVCKHNPKTLAQFEILTKRLDAALRELKIPYFLCYGSLWGALRYKKTLFWDRNLDFCALYNDVNMISSSSLSNVFHKYELSYYYNSKRGKYVIKYGEVTAEITLFEKNDDHLERVGWHRLFNRDFYKNYQNVPIYLVDNKPLPLHDFNNIKVPVPHNSFEIQKYIYPENWWLIIKPKGC